MVHPARKQKLINNNVVNLQWLEEMGRRDKASFQQTYCFVIFDFIFQKKKLYIVLYYFSHVRVRSLADNGVMVHRQNDQ